MIPTWQSQEAPTPEEIQASAAPSIRVDEGTIRHIQGSPEQQIGVTRHNTAFTPFIPGDIFSTARNAAGSPTSQRLPETTIELEPGNPGSRTTLAAAMALGVVTKNALGDYIPAGQASGSLPATEQQAQPEQPQGEQQQEPGGPEYFAPELESMLAGAVADVPPPLLDQAVAKAASSIAAGGDIEDFAASISATTGIPEAKLREAQGAVVASFQAQADSSIEKLGVDPQQFYEWAKTNHPEKLGEAVRNHLFARSLSGYRSLAKTFLSKTSPPLEELAAKGFNIKPSAAGKGAGSGLVTIQGITMELSTAARLGLLDK